MDVDEQERERELCQRFKQGDEAAFAELVQKYQAPLTNYILGRIQYNRGDLAETLIGDVLLEAWNKRDQFDEEKSSFTTWIHMRAKCRLVDAFRKRQQKRTLIEKAHPFSKKIGSGAARFSFSQPDEQDKAYVPKPKTRKEKRESQDYSDLDKSTRRLLAHIFAYGGNLYWADLSPRDHRIIAMAQRFVPKKEIARKLGMTIRACDTAICRIIKEFSVNM